MGFIEELCKYISVKSSVYHSPKFTEPVKGILYGICAGLGFGILTNLGYIMQFKADNGLSCASGVGILRWLL